MGTNPDSERNRGDPQQDQQETGGAGQQGGDQQAGGTSGQQGAGQQTGGPQNGLADWVTETFLRTAVAVLGVLLLLFALGQIAGFDTIGTLADLLATEVVQWLLVAVFALLLILAASKNWNINTSN